MPTCIVCDSKRRDARNRKSSRGGRRAVHRVLCDDCEPNTLSAVRERAADDAARSLLGRLYIEHEGSLVRIAKAAATDRVHVRRYLRLYGIGRYAR